MQILNTRWLYPRNPQQFPVIIFSNLEELNKEFDVVLPREHLADVGGHWRCSRVCLNNFEQVDVSSDVTGWLTVVIRFITGFH